MELQADLDNAQELLNQQMAAQLEKEKQDAATKEPCRNCL